MLSQSVSQSVSQSDRISLIALIQYTFGYINISLGDICKFTYGYTDKAKDIGDTRFIRITDIDDSGNLRKEDAKYIDLNNESEKYLLNKGDLLVARTGATFGKTLCVPDNKKSVYASFLIKLDIDERVLLKRYYWHFTKSQKYWTQANKLVSQGGQPQFNTNAISRIKLTIPTLEKQSEVVSILDKFDKICNDLNTGLPAEIEARQKQYEYYRDKLLTFKEV